MAVCALTFNNQNRLVAIQIICLATESDALILYPRRVGLGDLPDGRVHDRYEYLTVHSWGGPGVPPRRLR